MATPGKKEADDLAAAQKELAETTRQVSKAEQARLETVQRQNAASRYPSVQHTPPPPTPRAYSAPAVGTYHQSPIAAFAPRHTVAAPPMPKAPTPRTYSAPAVRPYRQAVSPPVSRPPNLELGPDFQRNATAHTPGRLPPKATPPSTVAGVWADDATRQNAKEAMRRSRYGADKPADWYSPEELHKQRTQMGKERAAERHVLPPEVREERNRALGLSIGSDEADKRRAELRKRMGIGGGAPTGGGGTATPASRKAAGGPVEVAGRPIGMGEQFNYELSAKDVIPPKKGPLRPGKDYDYALGAGDMVKPDKGSSGLAQFLQMKGAGAIGGDAGAMASASGMLKAGPMAALTGAVGLVKVGMDALQGAMSKTAETLTVLGDSSTTAAQKTEELGRALPVVGGLIGSFIDLREAVDGTKNRIKEAQRQAPINAAEQKGSHEMRMAEGQRDMQMGMHLNRAVALRGLASNMPEAPLEPYGGSHAEKLEYRKKQILYQPQVEKLRAEAELKAAQQSHADATLNHQNVETTFNQAQARTQGLVKARKELEAKEGGRGKTGLAGAAGGRNGTVAEEMAAAAQDGAPPPTLLQRMAGARGKVGEKRSVTESLAHWYGKAGTSMANFALAAPDKIGGAYDRVGLPSGGWKGMGAGLAFANQQISGALGLGGQKAPERQKADINQAATTELQSQNDLLMRKAELTQSNNQLAEAGTRLAEKESEVRKKDIEIAKSKLAVLKQEIQTIRGADIRLGGMSEMKKAQGLAAIRQEKKHGFRALPMEMRQLIEEVGGSDYANTLKERAAKSDTLAQAIKQETGITGDAAQKTVEAQKLQTEVNVKIALDESALAAKIATVIEKSFAGVLKQIEINTNAVIGRTRAGQAQAANLGTTGPRG